MTVLFLMAGIASWSLLEYSLHRFAGHRKRNDNDFTNEHLAHHKNPQYFAPAYKKAILMVVVLGAAVMFTIFPFGWERSLAFSGGLAGMYFFYEWLHKRFHTHPPLTRYGMHLRKHHFYHHFKNPRYNHGVCTLFWDRVFGTYKPTKVLDVPQKMAPIWMLDSKGNIKPKYTGGFALRERRGEKRRIKKASTPHRVATTAYPCCGQALGDSAGADRVGLARRKDMLLPTTLQLTGDYFLKEVR